MHHGAGVKVGPRALSNGNVFPRFGSGVKGVHGPSGSQGIAGRGAGMAEYGFIACTLHENALHASGRKRIVAVGDENIVAESSLEHANCVVKVAPGSVGILAKVSGIEP